MIAPLEHLSRTGHLNRFFIEGTWRDARGAGEGLVVNPATEEAIARIRLGNEEDVNAAVAELPKAGTWQSWRSSIGRLAHRRCICGACGVFAALSVARLNLRIQPPWPSLMAGPALTMDFWSAIVLRIDVVRGALSLWFCWCLPLNFR